MPMVACLGVVQLWGMTINLDSLSFAIVLVYGTVPLQINLVSFTLFYKLPQLFLPILNYFSPSSTHHPCQNLTFPPSPSHS
jgi:hypothetical protein